jgi:hypothetical protein
LLSGDIGGNMKAHILMKSTSGYGIYQMRREDVPEHVYATRKKANQVAREKNAKSTSCEYWVVSREIKET